jgi:hypothetical protein
MSYDEEIAKADALVRELEAKPLRTLPPATNWKLSATASRWPHSRANVRN